MPRYIFELIGSTYISIDADNVDEATELAGKVQHPIEWNAIDINFVEVEEDES